jgi:oligoribonuclease
MSFGFCFLDIETTGLDPNKDVILEVALVLTDSDLNELVAYHYPVKYELDNDDFWPDIVREMHTVSGLMEEVFKEVGPPVGTVDLNIEDDLIYWKSLQEWERLHLAGNSIHFDASFLKVHMPRAAAVFHHRMLDISSFKLLGGTVGRELVVDNENPHRALNDAYESLASARIIKEWIKPNE